MNNKLEKIIEKIFKVYCIFCKHAGIFGLGMFTAAILEYGINAELMFGIIIALLVHILPTLYLKKLKKDKENYTNKW